MKILFLDAYFEPEETAFTHLEKNIIEALVLKGHEIYVLCPTPTRGIQQSIRNKYKKMHKEDLYDGNVHVTRFYAPNEGILPFFRAIRYFWCNFQTFVKSSNFKNIDVIFANSSPPTQGWIAGKIAKKMKIPFVYNLQDIFPDSLVNANMTKKGSLIWRIGYNIAKQTYYNSDRIITISERFKHNVLKTGFDKNKIIVVPNWVSTEEVFPITRENNILFDRYNLDRKKFYVSYCGNVGHSQNFELLIKVAIEIQKRNSEIVFVIIGDGATKNYLKEQIKINSLSNMILLPPQSYDDIAYVFSLGDVGLVISKKGVGGSSVPSKIVSIMAAKRPVLASFDLNSELADIIRESGCGLIVDADKKELLVDMIFYMYNNREVLNSYSISGYKYISCIIRKDNCVNKYIKILESVK